MLTNTLEIVQKVAEMQSEKIRLHVEFATTSTNRQPSVAIESIASFLDI